MKNFSMITTEYGSIFQYSKNGNTWNYDDNAVNKIIEKLHPDDIKQLLRELAEEALSLAYDYDCLCDNYDEELNKINELQNIIEMRNDENNELNAEIYELAEERDEQSNEIDSLRGELTEYKETINSIRENIMGVI